MYPITLWVCNVTSHILGSAEARTSAKAREPDHPGRGSLPSVPRTKKAKAVSAEIPQLSAKVAQSKPEQVK